MAFITSFIYCGNTKEFPGLPGQGNQTQIIDPIQVIKPEFLPTYFTFSIACSIYGIDIKQENVAKLQFKDPQGNILTETENICINIGNDMAHLDMLQLNVDLRNVVLRNEGIYYAEVILNRNSLGKYKIPVVKEVKV